MNYANLSVAAAALALCALPKFGWALTVNPGRTELWMAPGKHADAQVMLKNETASRLHVEMSTKDWFVLPANWDRKLSVDKWLSLKGPRAFDMQPGEERAIKFHVRCPKNAVGELVGMISAAYITGEPSMVTPMISVSVYLQVAGTEQREGYIDELAARIWNKHIQVAASVKSTGNVHLRPTGTFRIFKAGQEVATFQLNAGNPTYPGNSQGYLAEVPANFQLEPGPYELRADLKSDELSLTKRRGFVVNKDGSIVMDAKGTEPKTAS